MPNSSIELIVLGITQDGGFPQAGCYKACCNDAWNSPDKRKFAISLALVNYTSKQWWLFEATPDFREQLHLFRNITQQKFKILPDGIVLSHAHIGHYTGLIHLGMEAASANKLPLYVQPKMFKYLSTNGPWRQLVEMENVDLHKMNIEEELILSNEIKIETFEVPHRDEFSETVGFKIKGANKSVLFIPDIDKWQKWNKSITNEIESCNYAILDGSFYEDGEIKGRSMEEIAHPFITESMQLFENISTENKHKIYFAHLNHTNPVLDNNSIEYKAVINQNFNILSQGSKFSL